MAKKYYTAALLIVFGVFGSMQTATADEVAISASTNTNKQGESSVVALDITVVHAEENPVEIEVVEEEADETTVVEETEVKETVVAETSTTGSSIVATALSYTGVPYVWSGTYPSGWDCIGFVRYVYSLYGVNIGGYTTSVLSVGTEVPYSEVQPGDILYWPGHVAISLGNGQNIAAWNESIGTTTDSDSLVGGTPTVIRVF